MRACTRPGCRRSTCSSGRAASSAISNFLIWQAAVRRALLHRPALARLRAGCVRRGAGRVRAAPSPLRALTRARACDSARSARPILVPVLLVVLVAGRIRPGRRHRGDHGLAALEVFKLLRAAGLRDARAVGRGPRAVLVLDAAFPEVLEGSGLLLGAIGIVLVAVAAFTRLDPHEGLATWMATIFGALYVSLLVVRHPSRARGTGDPAGRAALRSWRRSAWILVLILSVWAFDTGAYLVGQQFGRPEVPDPHLAVEDRTPGWSAASSPATIVRRGRCCGRSASRRTTRSCSGR